LIITNAQSVDSLKPQAVRYAAKDSEVAGLALRVYPDGRKVWTLRYRNTTGEQPRLKLGEYPRLSLHAARGAANKALREVDSGGDPQGERRAVKAAAALAKRDSIEALTTAYVERHARPRKRTWRADQHKVDRIILPAWRRRPVTSITRRDCRELLQAIADRGAPIQANRVAALLSRLFRFAVDEELVEHNIAAKLPKLGVEITARPEGDREIKPYDDDEITAIWTATARQPAPVRALYRLGLVTGQRPGEISDMAWAEITGDWWAIPPERAKNNRSHRIYLTALARKELALVPKHDALVFAGYRGKRQLAALNLEVFADVRRREKPRHAMRDTVATRMAEAGVAVENVSRVLNHAVGLRVTAGYNAYAYDAEKRAALETWADRLDAIINPKKKAAAKVVRMRRA
jgi:integrase